MDTFVFLGFGVDAWITIVTVFAMFTVLLFTRIRSDVVFLIAVGILYVTGVLDAKEALSGISQTSVAVVGVLFVVIAGLMHTGVLQWIVKHLLGTPKGYARSVLRLMLPVAALSSFFEQHDRRGAICEHRQDVVEETRYLAFETAYSVELCFGYGRCMYLDRYAS